MRKSGTGHCRDTAPCWTCTYLRWEQGELVWIDPATGRPIATLEDERTRALREREARIEDREARATADAERNAEREARIQEREARLAAGARVRELEEENHRLRVG